MTRHLLDTSILSDLIRNPQGPIERRIRTVGENLICTSIVVAAELRYGATKRGSKQLTAQVEAVLDAMEIAPIETPTDHVYGKSRADLETAGTPIGGNDLLIAAQAVALGVTVVTDKVSEFERIEGLAGENWLDERRDSKA